MATRRADDRPKRDIPDGEDEVPLDASALMEHLRDMETKLNLMKIDFDAVSAKYKTLQEKEQVLEEKVAHQRQRIYDLEDDKEATRVDFQTMREEFAAAKLHIVRLQKTIDLKNSSEGARIRLWDVFRDLYTLDRGERDLAFENTAIGDEGAMIVAGSLEAFADLESLSLAGNAIGLRGIDALAVPIIETRTLKSINLSNNAMGDDAAPTLAVIMEQTGLMYMNLSGNRIACEGAVVLSRVLEAEKPRLQTLVLSENKVSARGSGALCQTLLSNTTLTFLSLAGNQLGDYGATEVASMLRLNQTLTEVNLVANDIRDAGVRELCAGTADNFTLRNLRVNGNDNIGPVSKKLLVTLQQTSVSKKLRVYF